MAPAYVKIEVNEKMLKIPCSEFFIYDFTNKKYISIGKGDFSIEIAKTDEKKENPLLIFRNSVLKILFQASFKAGITKLETVNKNFKTISVIQKALLFNEETKKLEAKSVKIFHVNDTESKMLIESFAKLEKDAEQSSKQKAATESAKNSKNSKNHAEEANNDEIDINQFNTKSQPNASAPSSENAKSEFFLSKKAADDNLNKIADSTSKNNVININNMENTSKPSSRQQTESVSLESKKNVISQNKNQVSLSQKSKEANKSFEKAAANESKSTPIETKIVITENIQGNPNENSEQITIQVSTNQATGSKGKTPGQLENEKPVFKGNISESKFENNSASQANNHISVGKITNISIQLISSNKSQDKN